MKKFLFKKKWKKLFAGGVLCAVLVSFVCLRPLDVRPYFELPAFQDIENYSQNESVQTEKSSLKVGYSRLQFDFRGEERQSSFPDGLPLAGYGQRSGKPMEAIHDPVYIACLSFETPSDSYVLFAMDTLIVPFDVARSIESVLFKKHSVKSQNVFFSATHTHAGFGGWAKGPVGNQFAGKYTKSVELEWINRAMQAYRDSRSQLNEITAIRSFEYPMRGFIKNRLVGDLGLIHDSCAGTIIERGEGRSILIGAFAAHPTLISSDVMELSSGYPGFWRNYIENNSSYSAIFLGGAMGSHSPVTQHPGPSMAKSKDYGVRLAQLLLEHLKNDYPASDSIHIAASRLNLNLPQPVFRLSDHLMLAPWITNQLIQGHEKTYIQSLRLGGSIFLGMPGDFSGELAEAFSSTSSAKMINPIFTSFNGDYIGYIVPSKYYYLNSYETQVMSFYGHAWSDLCMKAVEAMWTKLR